LTPGDEPEENECHVEKFSLKIKVWSNIFQIWFLQTSVVPLKEELETKPRFEIIYRKKVTFLQDVECRDSFAKRIGMFCVWVPIDFASFCLWISPSQNGKIFKHFYPQTLVQIKCRKICKQLVGALGFFYKLLGDRDIDKQVKILPV